MKTKILVLVMILAIHVELNAQEDIHYNHIFSTATYYNPSFAGINGRSSFSGNFTDSDFEHYNPGVYSYYFSFDTYLDSLQTGVGLMAYFNKIIPGNGSAGYIGAVYAPKLRIGKKFNLSPSLKPGYIHNHENVVNLAHDTVAANKDAFDLAGGILLNSKRYFVGFSVDHLFEPKINYRNNTPVTLKRKYNAQFGYHYAKNDSHGSFIHFNMLCQYQGNSYTLFASNYYVGKKIRYSFMGEEFFHRILLGAGYKLTNDNLSENGLFLGIGTQEKNLTFGLGFQINLATSDLNVIETSIKYTLKSN